MQIGEVKLEIKTSVLLLNYFKNLVTGNTSNILPFPIKAQKPLPQTKPCQPLPTCKPESMGVSSEDICDYLIGLSDLKLANVHTVTVLRGGKVICRANYAPYSTNYWHITHSISKTFTSVAIGMLVDDNVLSTKDKICDIFPEQCTFLTSKRIKNITVEHLLTMTSGANFAEMGSLLEKDWIASFFSYDCMFEPGTKFNYNSMNTYMLSAIVTKKTGKTLYSFLKERLFDKLGFGSIEWESCPNGITKAGWGMYILPEDAAKLGLLFNWNGKWHYNGQTQTIVSESWINASLNYIFEDYMDTGYGYQLWYENSSKTAIFNGIFGQNVFVNKSLDMVIVINSGSTYLNSINPIYDLTNNLFNNVKNYKKQNIFTQFHNHLLLNSVIKNLKYNNKNYKPNNTYLFILHNFFTKKFNYKFKNKINTIDGICNALDNKTYNFTNCKFGLFPVMLSCMNDFYTIGLKSIKFENKNDTLYMIWDEGNEFYNIPIGFNSPQITNVSFGQNVFKIATTGVFTTDEDDNLVLKLTLNFLESSSTQQVKLFLFKNHANVSLYETPNLTDVIKFAYNLPKQNLGPDVSFIVKNNYIKKFAYKFCYPVHTSDIDKNFENFSYTGLEQKVFDKNLAEFD